MTTLPPQEDNEGYLSNLRFLRNMYLDSTDKYVVVDYPHATEEKKQEWFAYRKALRDLPKTVMEQNVVLDDYLTNVTWPTPPS